MSDRRVQIIAGPNGAGKTTFAREYLPRSVACPTFLNADLIAAGLSPFAPEQAAARAARLMLVEMDALTARGESFGFETTLAGRGYVRRIAAWQRAGYRITLVYLSLPSPEMAVARVAERVQQGGHDVPEDVIRRRFVAGRRNFDQVYRPIVDEWALYDNTGPEPRLMDWGERS